MKFIAWQREQRERESSRGSGSERGAAAEWQQQRRRYGILTETFLFFRRAALVVVVALIVVVLLLAVALFVVVTLPLVAALFVVVVVAVFSRCKMFGCGACEMCFFPSETLEIYCLFMMPLSTLNCKFNRLHRCPHSPSLSPTPFLLRYSVNRRHLYMQNELIKRVYLFIEKQQCAWEVGWLYVWTCKHWICYKYAINLL